MRLERKRGDKFYQCVSQKTSRFYLKSDYFLQRFTNDQCWCDVIQLIKKCIAWIFSHIAIAKKYRTFFCPFDRNIAGNIAKISAKYHVFQPFSSKFQAKFGSKPQEIPF